MSIYSTKELNIEKLPAIWSKFVLLHDLFVIYSIPNVNVNRIRSIFAGWIEVDDVWFVFFSVEICELFHKCCLK